MGVQVYRSMRAHTRDTHAHASVDLHSHVRTRTYVFCGIQLREAGRYDKNIYCKKLGKERIIKLRQMGKSEMKTF